MPANKPHNPDERLTFTTTHCLRRLLVKHWHLIEKSHDCLTCKALDTKPYIRSTSKSTYHNLKIKNTIGCKTRNIIYVITCTRCKTQYTGMTTQPLHNRFSTHMREMFSKRPPNWVQTRLYRHFQKKHHVPPDVRVQPVEWIEDRRRVKKRESAWIKNNGTLWTKHHPIAYAASYHTRCY